MTKRRVETYITPTTDREWPADHPLRRVTKVASPETMAKAGLLICRRVGDPDPGDIATAIEFRATCRECGEAIIHRALPNPTVEFICIYCWNDSMRRP